MAFDPLREKGTPLDKQFRSWSDLAMPPYDPATVHPYTRTRIILMNGIEVEAAMFLHQWARHTQDADLKKQLALLRRIEQQQQKAINWLPSPQESPLEVTIGYEQVAVDLTAWLARHEPDPYVKDALDFALLEDFDHLYRYANALENTQGKSAEPIVGDYTEIFPGRPTIAEHRHPFDDVRRGYDAATASPATKMNVETIVAAEQQTMNFYMNIGALPGDETLRRLYQEIAMIEEAHVTHYESLADPRATWFERAVLHEFNECWLYWSCTQTEVDPRIKDFWERCLADEITHLHVAADLLLKHQGRDARELVSELPDPMVFESNKEYVRDVLTEQIDLTCKDTEFVSIDDRPRRYDEYQQAVNDGGTAPSQTVIEEHIERFGEDYRLETEGPVPVERLRARDVAVV